MALLRMREATFLAGDTHVGPLTVEVRPGERAAWHFPEARQARVAALLAAGIVKAGSGCVLIEEFDPRVQSTQCKRLAAFVPHDPLPLGESDFERYMLYRAALWGVDAMKALAHAQLLLERLSAMHEAFAYPLVGALIASPKLLVLDRPQPLYAEQILDVAGTRAVVSTHTSPGAAQAFRPQHDRSEAPA
jgi:hypothetical protein